VHAEGFKNFSAYADSLRSRFPFHLHGEPVRRIRDGALCLNDPVHAEATLAIFEVGGTAEFLERVARKP
jgi:hypothetical protein